MVQWRRRVVEVTKKYSRERFQFRAHAGRFAYLSTFGYPGKRCLFHIFIFIQLKYRQEVMIQQTNYAFVILPSQSGLSFNCCGSVFLSSFLDFTITRFMILPLFPITILSQVSSLSLF